MPLVCNFINTFNMTNMTSGCMICLNMFANNTTPSVMFHAFWAWVHYALVFSIKMIVKSMYPTKTSITF